MKNVLIVGSGISGMTCAIRLANHGVHVTMVSPYPSERAQSVMAAGGINAVTEGHEAGDSVESHIEDTLKGGAMLGGENAVAGLCQNAEKVIRYLESVGTVFSVDEAGRPMMRPFGGQSHTRTHYCGSATGKHIVSALIMEVRQNQALGRIDFLLHRDFHSALIRDGVCHGALIYNEHSKQLETVTADAVVMAVGGQNALFGKTTGSTICDGYAAGKLFMQGALLKNLEFIQYHPTTIETGQKRMLITEAARGEGGRLFYYDGENTKKSENKKYFMEEKYGPKGNLMTRDVVSREIYATGREVFLDISFLDRKVIDQRLSEVRDLCKKYIGLDVSREPIPVAPSVHFFMGGLAVHLNHETSIRNLYAVGECASMYHGANRLGGNSLLAAAYSGAVAADDISGRSGVSSHPGFEAEAEAEQKKLTEMLNQRSPFPVIYMRDSLARIMKENLGIVRNEANLDQGIESVDYDLSVADRIRYDGSVSVYTNYSLIGILTIARAVLTCAKARKESRGAHYRSDYPESAEDYRYATLISYDDGNYHVSYDREKAYEN